MSLGNCECLLLARRGDRWRHKSVSGEIIADTWPAENNKWNKGDEGETSSIVNIVDGVLHSEIKSSSHG